MNSQRSQRVNVILPRKSIDKPKAPKLLAVCDALVRWPSALFPSHALAPTPRYVCFGGLPPLLRRKWFVYVGGLGPIKPAVSLLRLFSLPGGASSVRPLGLRCFGVASRVGIRRGLPSLVQMASVRESHKLVNRHAIIRRLRMSARASAFVFEWAAGVTPGPPSFRKCSLSN